MADNKLIDIKAFLELLKDWKIALATTIATMILLILDIKHIINCEQNILVLIIGLFVYSLTILLLSFIPYLYKFFKNKTYECESKMNRLKKIFCDFRTYEDFYLKQYKYEKERELLINLYNDNVQSFNVNYIKNKFQHTSNFQEETLNILIYSTNNYTDNKLIKFDKGKYTIDDAVWKELKKYKENGLFDD